MSRLLPIWLAQELLPRQLNPPYPTTPTTTDQQGDGERAARQLLERRKQLTALQTNLGRDREDLEGLLEREIVRALP